MASAGAGRVSHEQSGAGPFQSASGRRADSERAEGDCGDGRGVEVAAPRPVQLVNKLRALKKA